MTKIFIAILVAMISTPVAAQWLDHPTPGMPRTADGKPNLAAPAPRTPDGTPDLSGLWGMNAGAYFSNVTTDLNPGEIQPWADALVKRRIEDLWKDDPGSFQCLPQGPRANLFPFLPVKIIQTPTLLVILYEDLTYRQIFLDGRELPKDPNPSFMGYSVGRWDGNTFVVESTGFNDRTWLDGFGHPHTEALRSTERFRRVDFGHMTIDQTFTDPAIYARPFTITIQATFAPDTELLEFVCAENEKDHAHLVGKASDDKKYAVKVATGVLAKYVGMYEFSFPENPSLVLHYNITVGGSELFFDTEGKDKTALIPLSDTLFSMYGDRMQFVMDERGLVTHFEFIAAEGNLRATRKR